MTELSIVRIYISEARGMCTDEMPHEHIDLLLARALDTLDALEMKPKDEPQ